MNLETARCTIREFTVADIDAFMEYRNNNNWMRYQGFKGLTKDAYMEALCGNTSLEKGKQFAVINTETKQLIGDMYLKQNGDVFWLGYTVSPKYSRQGYASEACTAVIHWVAEHGGTVIMAGSNPKNSASISLLEKLGFTCLKEENGELVYLFDCVQRQSKPAE